MKQLIDKYVNKLVAQGVCETGQPLMGCLDAELVWNKTSEDIEILEEVVAGLNINSILLSKPASPYSKIINYLTDNIDEEAIYPQDCETRTFLHDIPVISEFNSEKIIPALKKRKAAIIPNKGIITYGTVSPEQTFITYSSVCFACFVKFFADYYKDAESGKINKIQNEIFNTAHTIYSNYINSFKLDTPIYKGKFNNQEDVIKAMIQGGKLVVDCRLVDSFFGNISYLLDNIIYISQTTSSLDELAGCIDPCPVDNSRNTALTASSELSAHKDILLRGTDMAILHGHPKFSVIMSMICDREKNCSTLGNCHNMCPHVRYIDDIPIVSGEVGTGKFGLCNTLPPAIIGKRGAIVYGHGLFTTGRKDFTDAFENLLLIEKMCLDKYISDIKKFKLAKK
ncbi:MAG TPA: class II aldolase/adducin family protein [Victivallales bacterium]|nr:class II aldolase/adducin family protein [Victivallales bacterium]